MASGRLCPYQVGEMTKEAYRLLVWLRVILPVVFTVLHVIEISTLLSVIDTYRIHEVIAYLLYSIRTEEMTQPRP